MQTVHGAILRISSACLHRLDEHLSFTPLRLRQQLRKQTTRGQGVQHDRYPPFQCLGLVPQVHLSAHQQTGVDRGARSNGTKPALPLHLACMTRGLARAVHPAPHATPIGGGIERHCSNRQGPRLVVFEAELEHGPEALHVLHELGPACVC